MNNSLFGTVNQNDYARLVGRIAMGILFIPSGWGKLVGFNAFLASLAARTLPFEMHFAFPEVWAALAVAAELGGGLLLLFGVRIRWVALLMVVFVIIATLTSHRYWEFADAVRRAQSVNFYKNVAIIGGLLFLYASGAGALSTDGLREQKSRSASSA
jgi:putative oxidoreductase